MKKNENKKEILVSIVLSESTSSLLCLDVPNIEEHADVRHSTCIIRPETSATLHQLPSVFSYIFKIDSDNNKSETNEISVEMAYFSDHFPDDSNSTTIITDTNLTDVDWTNYEEDYFDDIDVEDEDIIPQPMQLNLKATRVFMKPLLNAKTAAHKNNISIEDNEIFINLNDEDDDNISICSSLMCRICHGGESVGDLLKPCRCRGTIALAHLECLEHWLKESANSYCELCKHHFKIVREPKYGLLWSIFVYLTNPGEHFHEVVMDLFAFVCYTPSAIATTYTLMVICENMAKIQMNTARSLSAHLVACCAIFGMAAIDFTYSSWLILTLQRHAMTWRSWYRNNSYLKVVLPEHKKKVFTSKYKRLLNRALESQSIANDPNIAGSVSAQ